MVNHLRTVLLNVTAGVAPDSVYIDPAFRPVIVPYWLQKLQGLVLPYTTNPASQSFQLATVMRLLHAADYEQFTLLPDLRYTYQPVDEQTFFDNPTDPTAALDFGRLYDQVRSEVTGINRLQKDLFTPVSGYPGTVESLRKIWNNDLTHIGRLTGAILALGYQLDNLRG